MAELIATHARAATAFAAAIGVALTLAACGSSSSSASRAADTTSSAGGGAAQPSTAAAGSVANDALAGKKAGLEMFAPIPEVTAIANDVSSTAKQSGSGMATQTSYANGSVTKSETDLQTFLAQGANGIWTTLGSTVGLEPLAAEARQRHVPWVNFSGSALTGATTNIVTNNYQLGYLVGQATARWMQTHGKSSASVGATEGTGDGTNTLKTTGFIAGVHSILPNVHVYTAADNGVNSNGGLTAGGNLLQAHPDLAVLFGWFNQDAVGLAQAAKQAGKVDPKTFLVSTVDTDDQVFALVAHGSVLQLALDQNDQLVAVAGARLLQEAMAGRSVPPAAVVRPSLITPTTAVALEKRDTSPSDYPAAVSRVLQFSSTPLTTSESPHGSLIPLGA